MNVLQKPIRTFLFSLIAAAAICVNITACSSGTENGDTNVEKGTTKSRNPEKGNPNALNNRDRGSTTEEAREQETSTAGQKDYYDNDALKERKAESMKK